MKTLPRHGTSKTDVYSEQLCEKIRARLKKTKKELPDKVIKTITTLGNKEIGKWILENQEGFLLHDMGALAISKHLPKELRVDKEEILEKIQALEIPEYVRKIYLKRYDVDFGRRIDISKIKELGEKVPHMNPWSFFYTYRGMWFNRRNCIYKKAEAYWFEPCREIKKQIRENVLAGKDYFEYTFDQWYNSKIKPR